MGWPGFLRTTTRNAVVTFLFLVFGALLDTPSFDAVFDTAVRAQTRPSAGGRALWIGGATLDSPDAVRRVLASAAADGVSTVIAPAPVYSQPFIDPFAALVTQAHERGLRVIASIDVARVTLPDDLPGSRDHVLYQHPEWLMVPREIAAELQAVDPRSPEYLGRLGRWTRANAARVDGLYVSPLLPDAATFVVQSAAAAVRRYAVDGVQLDAARYPGEDFDYSRRAMETFHKRQAGSLSPSEVARMDAVEAIDPFAYANEFPDEWTSFRRASLTSLVTRVAAALKDVRPALVVTAAVTGGRADGTRSLQEWQRWLDDLAIDALSSYAGTAALITADPSLLPLAGGAGGAGDVATPGSN